MAVPSSKEELIRAINSNFSLLNKKLESITPQLAFEPLLEGHAKGTTISVA
ncbi:colibactin self-protection protein ClbS, partial [Klebsiella pneumoniae]